MCNNSNVWRTNAGHMLNQVIPTGFRTDRADASLASPLNFLKFFDVYLLLNVTANIKQPWLHANFCSDRYFFFAVWWLLFPKDRHGNVLHPTIINIQNIWKKVCAEK